MEKYKLTNKDFNYSISFNSCCIVAIYNQLVGIFGSPQFNTGVWKTVFQWTIQDADGYVYDIYDWMKLAPYVNKITKKFVEKNDYYVVWNIRGMNREKDEKLWNWINNKLKEKFGKKAKIPYSYLTTLYEDNMYQLNETF